MGVLQAVSRTGGGAGVLPALLVVAAAISPSAPAAARQDEPGRSELLEDAVAPTDEDTPEGIAPAPGIAGWVEEEGGFVLMSPDRQFKLQLGFVGGYKFEPLLVEGEWQNRRAFFVLRPYMGGSLFRDWIRFFTNVELSANPPFLLQSFIEIAPWKELGLWVGQFGTPFSRHQYYSPNQILFPEWSVTSNYFASGYDKGLALFGRLAEDTLDWWAAVSGGSPLRQFTTLSGNYVVQGRLTYSPLGPMARTEFPYLVGPQGSPAPFGISFTANAWFGNVQLAQGNFNPTTFAVAEEPTGETNRNVTVGGDVFVQAGWFALFGEGFWRRYDPGDGHLYHSAGGWGQLGVLLVPHTFDAGVRLNYLDPSTELEQDTFRSAEFQVGWYLWRDQLVMRARYGIGEQRSPGEDALGPVVLPVSAVGTIHLFTVQGMIAF